MQEPWSSRSAKTPPKHGWAATTASRPPGRSTRRASASTGRRSSEVSGCHDGGYGVDGLVGEREPAGAAHDCGQSCSAGAKVEKTAQPGVAVLLKSFRKLRIRWTFFRKSL